MTDTQMFDAMAWLCAAGVIFGLAGAFVGALYLRAFDRVSRELAAIKRQRSDIVARGNRTRKAKRIADRDAMTAALRAGAGL